jgi:hypothetical protein
MAVNKMLEKVPLDQVTKKGSSNYYNYLDLDDLGLRGGFLRAD